MTQGAQILGTALKTTGLLLNVACIGLEIFTIVGTAMDDKADKLIHEVDCCYKSFDEAKASTQEFITANQLLF